MALEYGQHSICARDLLRARVFLQGLGKTEAEREHLRPGYFGPYVGEGRPVDNAVGILLCEGLLRDLDSALESRAGAEFELSATRTVLALHAFRHESGELPAALDELVSRYLGAVPSD